MNKKKRRSARSAPPQTVNPMMIGAGLLIIVLLVASYLLFGDRPQQGERDTAVYPAEVSVADAVTLRDSGAFFLDVREQDEWDSFHIPDSTHIPLGQLSRRLNELPTDQEIVVVCRTGNRSQEGRAILQAAGWEQVTSMAGGVVDWQAAGYSIVSGP